MISKLLRKFIKNHTQLTKSISEVSTSVIFISVKSTLMPSWN